MGATTTAGTRACWRAGRATPPWTRSALEGEPRLRDLVQASPDETVEDDHGPGHGHGGPEQHPELPGVGGVGDRRARSQGGEDPPPEVEVLGYDAGVPGPPRRRDQTGDQGGEDPGEQDEA